MSRTGLWIIIIVLLLIIVGFITIHPGGCNNGHGVKFGVGPAYVCIDAGAHG